MRYATRIGRLLCGAALLVAGCESGGPRGGGTLGSEDDVWAIRCTTLRGADQFRIAEGYAEALRRVAGLKADLVQVLASDDGTSVYYGRYRRVYGAEEAHEHYRPSPLRDLDTIRSLQVAGAEKWPFMLATMDVLPTYRPAHAEWDLNNQQAGYWSLHVAVFYNTDDFQSRRAAAEEYCRLLRERGEEAYYHHGTVNSSVYIGLFPKEAIRHVQREVPMAGKVVATTEIVDPQMQAAQQRFPESLHNGHRRYEVRRDPATGAVRERLPTPSFPVRTPRGQRLYEQTGRE